MWLDDAEALAQFDEAALRWGKSAGVLVVDTPALRLLYAALPQSLTAPRRRLMYLAFDIKVAYVNTFVHIHELAGSESMHLVREEGRTRFRPLDDPKSFGVAMLRSRAAFALVSRVRAIWDKLFLYVTLRFDGEEGMRILQNRRSKRKHFFSRYGRGIGTVSVDTMSKALADINNLERSYRSPELHGFGIIPPWVFESPSTWPYGHTSPILGHWSMMQQFLDQVFEEARGRRTSFDRPGEDLHEGAS